jgi:hypothetical protein
LAYSNENNEVLEFIDVSNSKVLPKIRITSERAGKDVGYKE